ncbi:hypothetical protein [Loigolactobacillus zhaoyuanensis]|uniref:Uncharacterized protein n=1 Tax=Loigolactobacillus zhaoyuanensis TaxID=2486017 RepID=A0ABW8U8A4_9LACO
MLELLPNNKLEAAFKKVISRDKTRPILQSVHFDKDGSLTGCDSHVLLRIDDIHRLKQDFNFNLKKFVPDSEAYPETERLIPTSFQTEINFDLADIDHILPVLKGLGKKELVKITNMPGNNVLDISNLNVVTRLAYDGDTGDAGLISITVNANYLAQCLEFFRFWVPASRVNNVSPAHVTLGYNGSLRPMVFTAEKATYLVTPVRTF